MPSTTGLILQIRSATTANSFRARFSLPDAFANLADKHRLTPSPRPRGAPASASHLLRLHRLPVGWTLSFATVPAWQLSIRVFVLQFGGAVGTLAALGPHGPSISKHLARTLSLPLPSASCAISVRIGRNCRIFCLLAGTLNKIARDLSLHTQTEIGELAEPHSPGRGPAPNDAAQAKSCCLRRSPCRDKSHSRSSEHPPGVQSQDHQRGLGSWHARMDDFPEIVRLTAAPPSSRRAAPTSNKHKSHARESRRTPAHLRGSCLDDPRGKTRPRSRSRKNRGCLPAGQFLRIVIFREVLASQRDTSSLLSSEEWTASLIL